MATRVDESTLDRQPKTRRIVYTMLEKEPGGRSVKDLLQDSSMPEADLRETLRKLEAAGLAVRSRSVWTAVALEPR